MRNFHLKSDNIIFLSSSYPSPHDVMNRTFMSDLAESVSELGIHIFIICPHQAGLPYREVQKSLTIIRFPYWFKVSGQRLGKTGGIMASISQSPIAIIQLIPFCICQFLVTWRTLKEEKIDLIHSHWLIPQGLIGAIIRFFTGIPHITSVHGTDIHLIHSHFLAYPLMKCITKNSNYITTNSTHTQRLVCDIIPKTNIWVIPMGIYVDDFRVYEIKSVAEEKIILFVGRLIALKGVQVLIEAMKKVYTYLHQCRLVIIGDGPIRGELEDLSNKLGISSKIQFLGLQDRQTLLSFYRQADLFVLPSITINNQSEGLGVVLLEAMASGVPVIGSNTGGIPYIIEDGVNGLLVSPGDSDALAKAIIHILENPDLADKFRIAGLQSIRDKFSWNDIIWKFYQIYNYAISDRV